VEPHAANDRHPHPFLLGVAGGSSSGKTTVAERLCELIGGDRIALIKLDSYYVDMPEQPLDVRAKANYDHPDAFDWELMHRHLQSLVAGEPVEVPVYDYAAYERTPQVTRIGRCDVVVVEGILVLYEPSIRDMFDLKVYVDADADLRLIRRLQRDVNERGRTVQSIIDQYLATVRPAHLQFIEPSKRHAHVIIPEGGRNEPALEVLLARVRELMAEAGRV
jgi:uridine kinase